MTRPKIPWPACSGRVIDSISVSVCNSDARALRRPGFELRVKRHRFMKRSLGEGVFDAQIGSSVFNHHRRPGKLEIHAPFANSQSQRTQRQALDGTRDAPLGREERDALAAQHHHHARAGGARAKIETRHRADLRGRIVKLQSDSQWSGGRLRRASTGRRRGNLSGAHDLDAARALGAVGCRRGGRQIASRERLGDCGDGFGAEAAGHPQRH